MRLLSLYNSGLYKKSQVVEIMGSCDSLLILCDHGKFMDTEHVKLKPGECKYFFEVQVNALSVRKYLVIDGYADSENIKESKKLE